MTSERGKRTAGSTTHVEALIAVAEAALVLSVGAYLTWSGLQPRHHPSPPGRAAPPS